MLTVAFVTVDVPEKAHVIILTKAIASIVGSMGVSSQNGWTSSKVMGEGMLFTGQSINSMVLHTDVHVHVG